MSRAALGRPEQAAAPVAGRATYPSNGGQA